MTATIEEAVMARPGSDRWYENVVRRTRTLRRDEETVLVDALEAHRHVVVRDVLGSRTGLAYLREIGRGLESRRLDVRSVVETDADVRVEDARSDCLARLGRIAAVVQRAGHRPLSVRTLERLDTELRDLGLRRAHVDAVVFRMRGMGAATAPALERLRIASAEAAHARSKLVEAHLRLVVALARRHQNRGMDLPDLVQEGTIGLMRAVDRFDARRGVVFATYAAWWVRQTIGRALAARARPVRLPTSVEDGIRSIRRHRRYVTLATGRRPSATEIAARVGLSADRVEELSRVEHELCRPMISLDDAADEDDRALLDQLPDPTATPEDTTLARRLRTHASEALRGLAPREQEVLTLRYGLGREPEHTLEDIGRRFGLTRQRILQIASRAIDKLRRSPHAKALRTFWDA